MMESSWRIKVLRMLSKDMTSAVVVLAKTLWAVWEEEVGEEEVGKEVVVASFWVWVIEGTPQVKRADVLTVSSLPPTSAAAAASLKPLPE